MTSWRALASTRDLFTRVITLMMRLLITLMMRLLMTLMALLLMIAAVMVWGAVAPPIEGHHVLFGVLTVSNYVGKFVYVSMLTCIAFLCCSVQLSGTFGSLAQFDDEAEQDEHAAHAH